MLWMLLMLAYGIVPQSSTSFHINYINEELYIQTFSHILPTTTKKKGTLWFEEGARI